MSTVSRTFVVVVAGLFAALGLAPAVAFAGPYENKCEALGTPAICKAGAFTEPIGAAVNNSTGEVYVAEYTNLKVLGFNANGEALSTFATGGTVPVWDAVDPATGDIYVSYLEGAGVVKKFKPNGTLEESFGTKGELTGLGGAAVGVAVQQSTGHLFVALREAQEVKEYDSSGKLLGFFKTPGEPIDSIAVDKAGDVYVDYESVEVKKFPAAERENPSVFNSEKPTAVAVDQSTGNVFVSHENSKAEKEITEYEASGSLIEGFGAGELGEKGAFGIGINESTHTLYATNRAQGQAEIFAPGTGAPEPLLNVERLGSGSGEVTSTDGHIKCGAECKHKYPENEKVTLEAHASAGSVFAKWEHCTSETAGKCEVTMTAAVTVTATFSEAAGPPLVQALAATAVTRTAATLQGTVNPDHETPVACAFHYALEESLAGASVEGCTPAANTLGSGNTPVPVSATIEGLTPNTPYYYRLTAANGTGASESAPVQQLLTLPNPPAVTTGAPSALAPRTATVTGSVNPGSSGHVAQDDTTYRFQYSTDESYSSQTTVADAGEGTSPVPVQASLEGLEPGTTYHYRLIAANNNDKTPQQVTGEAKTLTTVATPPAFTETSAGGVTQSSAAITSTLITQGLPARWELQLGTSPEALQYQAAGNSSGPEAQALAFTLEHLQPGTTYYYRLTAESPDGTGETGLLSFTTAAAPAVSGGAVAPSFPLLFVPPNVFPAEAPSHPVAHVLTTKQKLQNALKACRRKHDHRKRTTCEKQAHKKYKVK
jgi:phosphodiesterase/alkaline phosphatase D-like protein